MAGRPRLPEAMAKATGAAAKNPQRFRDRKEPKVAKLGPPPEHLSAEEVEAWHLFADEIPWLGSSDRAILIAAARLRARLIADTLPLSAFGELRQVLNALGATPAARTKVSAPSGEKEDDDPAGDYLN